MDYLNTAQPAAEDPFEEKTPGLPNLPAEVYNTLPAFFQRVTQVGETPQEKDILLLASLTTMGVVLNKVEGNYSDQVVHPNFYLFVSAPASAGKGIMSHCRKLLYPIHKKFRDESLELRKRYRAELAHYNQNKSKDPGLQAPVKPALKVLINPGNNSATGFLQLLNDNDQRGIIFETEGDTVANAFKSDYGDYSNAFRAAFHHEAISYFRRTDQEHVEMENPCLSAVLSGTPNQIKAVIPGYENGLFSRFVYYVMELNTEWKNVFKKKREEGIELHFEQLGLQFFEFYQKLDKFPVITFGLSLSQQDRFNQFFTELQDHYLAIQVEEIVSSVRRFGLIAFRMMMVFSALRLIDEGEPKETLLCDDKDFENTLQMVAVLMKHTNHVFTQMPKELKLIRWNRKERFFNLLPAKFDRQTYLEIAQQLNIPDKTVQRYIKDFIKGKLIKSPSHNHYVNLQWQEGFSEASSEVTSFPVLGLSGQSSLN